MINISSIGPIREFRSGNIRQPRDFAMPVFPVGMPLDLEIGCGVGWHPIRYAKPIPALSCRHRAHAHAIRGIQAPSGSASAVENLLPVHADAVEWVTHWSSLPGLWTEYFFSIQEIPIRSGGDLWNKRWHCDVFYGASARGAQGGREFRLATNERFYFVEAQEYFSEHWNLEIVEAASFKQSALADGMPRTHFEKKYLAARANLL